MTPCQTSNPRLSNLRFSKWRFALSFARALFRARCCLLALALALVWPLFCGTLVATRPRNASAAAAAHDPSRDRRGRGAPRAPLVLRGRHTQGPLRELCAFRTDETAPSFPYLRAFLLFASRLLPPAELSVDVLVAVSVALKGTAAGATSLATSKTRSDWLSGGAGGPTSQTQPSG